jgi:pyridoxamine 5'-phosphate oxidase family protein
MTEISLTSAEIDYIKGQPLARIATTSASGEPDVAAVFCTYRRRVGGFIIGGLDIEHTRKFLNVRATGRASIVFDDVASWDPYSPRGVKVTGRAEIQVADDTTKLTVEGVPVIVVTPERTWHWGLEVPAFGPDGFTIRRDAAVTDEP